MGNELTNDVAADDRRFVNSFLDSLIGRQSGEASDPQTLAMPPAFCYNIY